jgi:hypothetical protein
MNSTDFVPIANRYARAGAACLIILGLLVAGLALCGCSELPPNEVSSSVKSGFDPVAIAFLKNLKQELVTPVATGDGPARVYTLSGWTNLDVRLSDIPESPYMAWINVRCQSRVPGAATSDEALATLEFTWGWQKGRWELVSAEMTPAGSMTDIRLLPPYGKADDPLTARILAAAARTVAAEPAGQ